MLRQRCQRLMVEVVEDLEAMAFGGVGVEALDTPQHAGDTPASPPPIAAAAAEISSATIAIAEVVPAPMSSAPIVIDNSPP